MARRDDAPRRTLQPDRRRVRGLYAWAGQRDLLRFPEAQSFEVYLDDPETTDAIQLRSNACLTVLEGTPVDGDVAVMDIPGGLFAIGHFEIDHTEFGAAWDKPMCEYLPTCGYVPYERPCYEWCLNDPDQHPEHKFVVDICEPVRPVA